MQQKYCLCKYVIYKAQGLWNRCHRQYKVLRNSFEATLDGKKLINIVSNSRIILDLWLYLIIEKNVIIRIFLK